MTHAACWLFLFSLGFLIFQDVVYSYVIPGAARLRFIVPFLFTALMLFTRSGPEAVFLRNWTGVFMFAGLLSAIFGNSIELGILKLALYGMVVLPLVMVPQFIQGFGPGGKPLVWLVRVLVILVTASFLYFVSTGGWVFKNPNQLGMLTVCAMPLILYQWSVASSQVMRHWWLVLVFLALATAVLSASRASIGADLIMIMTFYSFSRTKSLIGASLIGAFVVLAGWLLMLTSDQTAQPVIELAYKGRESIIDLDRTLMFNESWEAVKNRPLFGYGFGLSWLVGPGDWDIVLRTGRLSWIVGEFGSSTLALLVGGGMVLTSSFYALFLAVLLRTLKAIRVLPIRSKYYFYMVGMLAGMLGLLVHAQAEGWLLSPLNWSNVMFWLYLGLASSSAFTVISSFKLREHGHKS